MRRGTLVVIACGLGCGSKVDAELETTAAAKTAPAAKDRKVAERPAPVPAPVPVAPTARPKTAATLADAEALAAQVYADHRIEFYCGCQFTADLRTLFRSCGYKTRADESRSKSVQWTHVVPARAFGAERSCWTTEACTREDGTRFGGIECCRAQDPAFAAIENDLHNLVPTIGEVAEDRSDYPFGEVAGEPRLYGACDLEVDAAAGVVEPPQRVRGDIARVHLYMNAAWGDAVPLSPEERARMEAWHGEDPPDAWEIERAAKIEAVQGFAHPWIAEAQGAGGQDVPEGPDGGAPTQAPG
ncbi:MAG TPA: endonuclease [Nannocystaceae bacterium]|nr:endonuclease [Nannocystaceae bacterium]